MLASQSHPSSTSSGALYTALQAEDAGLSVVPIRADGTKQPALAGWRQYQTRRASQQELMRWFHDPALGIALITGQVSEGLEALDFDSPQAYTTWLQSIQSNAPLLALFERISWGYLESTPAGGKHLLYRCPVIAGNQKLARKPTDGPEKYKTLIETRGEGGLIIIAPSRGTVHPSGKAYLLLRGGVGKIRTITPEERDLLLASTRAMDKAPVEVRPWPAPMKSRPTILSSDSSGVRPGDLFNQRATWEEVLVPHGWERVAMAGEEGQWRRPGKQGSGISATTNYEGTDLLYVFSTATAFEPERGYSKFAAYALLNFGGDYSAAARVLREQGYRVK